MNVYRFELRRTWKNAAVWTAALLALLAALTLWAYPVFIDGRAAVEKILAGFPPEFAAAFGFSLDDVFSYAGFYAFGFLYYFLFGAIMAAVAGLDIFSRENRNKCQDFLLTKPRGRGGLFCSKLLAALTLLTASNLLFILESIALYRNAGQDPAALGKAVLAASALFFTQIVMLAVSVFIAVFSKRIRSVSGTATTIGFAGFLLSALHSILEKDALRYITPFKYFDVTLAFSEGRFETPYVLTAAAVTLMLLALAFIRYCRADVAAA